jgi:recombination protein RecA
MYGLGISHEGDLLDLAVSHNIVEKSGAWFSFHGERLGQGRENVKNLLKADADIQGRIEAEVRTALGLNGGSEVESVETVQAAPGGSTRRAAPKE